MAIMIAKNERQVDYISKSSIILAAIFAITLSTSLIFVQFVFPNTTVADQLGWLITLTPIAAFMITIQEVNEYKAARKNAFTLTAAAAVTQSMLSNSARVAAGLVAPTAYPLIIISTLAPAINSIIISSVTADPKKKIRRFKHLRSIGRNMRGYLKIIPASRYKEFAVYRAPTDAISALAQTAPTLFFAAIFDVRIAGFLVLARSITNLPVNILGNSVGTVYYAKFAEMDKKKQKLLPFALMATSVQAVVPGTIMLTAAPFLPEAFTIVFGVQWATAGEYASWLVLCSIGMLANVPSVRALPIIRKQAKHLYLNLGIFASGIIGAYLGYLNTGTPLGAVIGYSIATFALHAVQIATYLNLINLHDKTS